MRTTKRGRREMMHIREMHNALCTIIKTPETVEWLEENDPIALNQARAAVGLSGSKESFTPRGTPRGKTSKRPRFKSLKGVATPQQLKKVRVYARECDVTVHHDKPYNHFKVGFARRWDDFMQRAACILPMDSWEEYTDIWGNATLRVRVK